MRNYLTTVVTAAVTVAAVKDVLHQGAWLDVVQVKSA